MATIAYLGIPGSYSYAAAQALFKADDVYRGAPGFSNIFAAVAKGDADYGVIPIENGLAGSIYDNYDLLGSSPVNIVAEHYLPIRHALLVNPVALANRKTTEAALAAVTDVYSHPKALEQCAALFAQHPHFKPQACSDTATASRLVSERHDATIAALASPDAATLYGLQIIKKCPDAASQNYTRFFVIAKERGQQTAEAGNKCSLWFRLPNRPGALREVLAVLADYSCNVSKLELRPIPEASFEYSFYLDFCFTPPAATLSGIMAKLNKCSVALRVLGVYQDQVSSVS